MRTPTDTLRPLDGHLNGYSQDDGLERLIGDQDTIAEIARRVLGKENARLSTRTELRFGTHGSLAVDLAKGAFYDHENRAGGGLLDLVTRKTGGDHAAAMNWLRGEGFFDTRVTRGVNGKAHQASNEGQGPVAVYNYQDEQGALLFQVLRYEPKDFKQRRPNSPGPGWVWSTKGVRRVPYRLPELLEAIAEQKTVFIVEGEKDVDNLARLGVVATCNAGGASKWHPEHAAHFKDADIIIVPDNDDPGRQHAESVAASLTGIAARVRILTVPDLPPKGDVSNWIETGGAAEEWWALAEEATEWRETVAAQPSAGDQHAADDVKAWPKLRVASYGLIGELSDLATRESEADPLAVMASMLATGAAAFGRNRFMRVGDTQHHARLMTALVGATARGRKGTSWGPVERVMRTAESILQKGSTLAFPSGLSLRISFGPLSSGEGLIEAIRDKRDDDDNGGTEDKRLLVVEGELGAALRACQRQGNTLSTLLRVAWDGWTLAPLTKRDKIVATDPHVCIVAHVTRHELAELLTASDIWNGFANRFLWTVVRRRAEVPFPKAMADADVERIGQELAGVIGYAHSREGAARELVMSNSAADYWAVVYSELTQEHSGILGAVTSRGEAQTLRLAMTYALFDGADRVELKHLEAALAFWRYSFDSAGYLFGGAELDPVAQKILEALATGPKTQTEISGLFDRHLPKARLAAMLAELQERGRITLTNEKTAGAPRKIWSLAS